ncbi:ATP-binding cassette domain-containing protein [Pseudomonas sp. MH9.2]|uniref:ATP-binding cassette domain-containing protein n=1 Tax=unclassified Pseudomonas TaxID=196821 RepID=UPI002AC8C69E|nr:MULTISPECIES: ATP-binding cassette domain-containing protein [unclassified Pseudomonas]MEB0007205.1 ATP-binding cassette domain-containing protein [Pseudomonas sp. RTB2]MEB0016936.1 ATP-binding cassette domain-containing protein [Pseudomonas sp. RTB3]MEB0027482.1 ATP-binding cassette domain-containing protein [Pseudomonas sp. MH9.2]MEB0147333.1 ATP-binding cassette domain-containing protein [Pseudomonas sp. CCC2.2]MEB0270455.1 ATP-binding cassette domain-containing protein [Pseudomonas sp. 
MFPRLQERQDQLSKTLSGDEQQIMVVARALLTNPQLLIFDETTEGLAPIIRGTIWSCLASLKAEGEAILVLQEPQGNGPGGRLPSHHRKGPTGLARYACATGRNTRIILALLGRLKPKARGATFPFWGNGLAYKGFGKSHCSGEKLAGR